MADNAHRRGAVDMGVILMVAAFAVIAGFLYWLNVQSAEERALEVVEDTASTATQDPSRATTVAAADIQLDASPYEGQLIRLAGLDVASPLGQQGFWLTMPNGNPFLVSMTDEARAEGVEPAPGRTVSVTGSIVAMNDSILTAWTEAGTIGEGERLAAEFATHFLEARRVEVSGEQPDTSGTSG